MKRWVAIVLLPLLGGCALGEADCRGVGWQERGYRDGYGGNPQQYSYLSWGCRPFGVEVPEAEYFKGYNDGYDEWYRLIGSRTKGGQ